MVEAYPLQWPEGYERSKSPRSSRFGKHTLHEVRSYLKEEVRRLGGEYCVISTNMKTRNDGEVYSNAKEPEDSGVAVYFQRKGRSVCLPCDTYRKVWENTYAIARGIAAMRQIERDGLPNFLDRAFEGFTALPETTGESWREVLEVFDTHPSYEDVVKAYRVKLKRVHPDHGGSDDEVIAVNEALDSARAEIVGEGVIST